MKTNDRRAGLLLHITSLPSIYGIGDLGPEAYRFVDFLAEAKASYWQILPLNPVDGSTGYSPYSSSSSIAGNPLLISPELLLKDGLVAQSDLKKFRSAPDTVVDFEKAERDKFEILDLAWRQFSTQKKSSLHHSLFDEFCQKHSAWLDAFALFIAIRDKLEKKPWTEWPELLAKADKKALRDFEKEHESELNRIKWFQFIFFRQWNQLRDYCREKGVELVGDLPFYVSLNSVDVWQNRHLFKVDKLGTMQGIAGVPPDYFNENGQLWMMPVYDWPAMKKNEYRWWKDRLNHNLALFDVLRLDHFRAFADYWEVPGGAETAKQGKWKDGPGMDFFDGSVDLSALLAEDLGDLSRAVLDLRDELSLPGMKVLQFAFGDKLAESEHAPHNYSENFFAYTGTHDNDTILGWYKVQNRKIRKQISDYCGKRISTKNVADELCRLIMSSVARVAILPVQDLLGLDETSRLNNPGEHAEYTWRWHLVPDQISASHGKKLRDWITLYGRGR